MIIVNALWLPMFVFGSAVFMVGMFFFARLLLFVRVPFTLRADQAAGRPGLHHFLGDSAK